MPTGRNNEEHTHTAAVVCVLQEHVHEWAQGGGGVAVSVTAVWVIRSADNARYSASQIVPGVV